MATTKCALILGGTGESGKRVLDELRVSDLISKIIMINRREIEVPEGTGKEKIEQKLVDFDKLDDNKEAFNEAEIAFCCLGTTRGKAGKEGFIKVDYDYVVNSAKILKEIGTCNDYHLISSWGAKANAWTLYPSTKGKAEEAVKDLGFQRTSIYRPGLLITGRQESRVLERTAQCMAGFLDRSSKASIKTEDLAKAMVFNATKKTIESAAETIEHATILELAKEATPTPSPQ
eukprot:01102.XXX_964_215_1 [CDS] Oithona nana genome sequencing.